MDHNELLKEMEMDYYELVEYLKKKYGAAQYDYFCNETCRSKNRKAVRTSEGLFCHHIDEDKANNLGNSAYACRQPYEYQKAERLVYCNYLEHLLLHIQIGRVKYWGNYKELNSPNQLRRFLTTGMVYLCCEINDLYDGNEDALTRKRRCFKEIEDNFEDYISILKSFIQYLTESYTGDKTQVTQPISVGQHVEEGRYRMCAINKHGEGVIKDIVRKGTDAYAIVKFADKEMEIPIEGINNRGYDETFLQIKKELSSNWKQEVVESIYKFLI